MNFGGLYITYRLSPLITQSENSGPVDEITQIDCILIYIMFVDKYYMLVDILCTLYRERILILKSFRSLIVLEFIMSTIFSHILTVSQLFLLNCSCLPGQTPNQ